LRRLDLGRLAYPEAITRMEAVLDDRIHGRCEDTLITVEHDPVFTLGRQRTAADNVLAPGEVPVIEVRRGGDVTFHGPGQLVGYPILGLPEHRHDLHGYLRGLEQVLIDTLAELGITGGRDPRNTGVWVQGKKIAAIGIAARKWVTWHGFALNIDTDLSYYSRINPCGMDAALVTRLSDHLSPCPDMATVTDRVTAHLQRWWQAWTAQSD
jgi:lipoate-protein ligase B